MWDMGRDVEYGVKCETWENNGLINSIDLWLVSMVF